MMTTKLVPISAGLAIVGLGALLVAGLPAAAQEPPTPGAVHRVLLHYGETGFELVSMTPLTSVLPPSEELPGEVGSLSGFWFELQNAEGQTVYRRIVGDPVRLVFEGPDPLALAGRAQLSRSPTPEIEGATIETRRKEARAEKSSSALDRGALLRSSAARGFLHASTPMRATAVRDEAVPSDSFFTVLIPAATDGDQLVLFASPVAPGTQAEPAVETARLDLQVGTREEGR
jgi:hypothetical protein